MMNVIDTPAIKAVGVLEACAACAGGPAGIEGHDELRVSALGGSAVRFACKGCRSLWSRTTTGAGGFAWARVDPNQPADRKSSAGIPLPTR